MSLLLAAVPLFAVQQTNCERNPHECVGPQGPQGEQGIPGVDGIDGVDGVDGKDGEDGTNGTNGVDGTNGTSGTDGATGADGKTGATGAKGDAGEAGEAGKDVDEAQVNALTAQANESKKRTSFANDSAAGNSAMASIDFGSIAKGETHGGLGVGVSHSWYGSSTAGAVGLKHGFTDETAGVVKVWSAGSNSYGGGAGVVHKF